MTYQVLARKWRPQKFADMIGQDHVVRALVNALDTGRLHHAYLFTGIRGVGKTTIARIFAKSLNCQTQGVSSEPCGECEACKDIEAGRFFDLIEVDAASRTGVDDTRELLENVAYAPAAGRYKVYLIDEVHMFTKNAFNALLKTLEEPPEHVKFILATTDPDKIPLTVLSRCLQFNLKGISQGRLAAYLQQLLDSESVEAEPAALTHIAQAAQGSVRDSLSLVEQGIALGGGRLTGATVEDMLGRVSPGRVIDLVAALGSGDAEAVLQLVESLSEYGPDYSQLLGEIMQILHRIAMIQNVPGSAASLVFHEPERVTELAASLSPEDVQLYHQTALLGRRDMPFAPDARDMFDMVLLRMLAFRPAQVPMTDGSGGDGPDRKGGAAGPGAGDGGSTPSGKPPAPPTAPAGAIAPEAGDSAATPTATAPSGPAALRAALAASSPAAPSKRGSSAGLKTATPEAFGGSDSHTTASAASPPGLSPPTGAQIHAQQQPNPQTTARPPLASITPSSGDMPGAAAGGTADYSSRIEAGNNAVTPPSASAAAPDPAGSPARAEQAAGAAASVPPATVPVHGPAVASTVAAEGAAAEGAAAEGAAAEGAAAEAAATSDLTQSAVAASQSVPPPRVIIDDEIGSDVAVQAADAAAIDRSSANPQPQSAGASGSVAAAPADDSLLPTVASAGIPPLPESAEAATGAAAARSPDAGQAQRTELQSPVDIQASADWIGVARQIGGVGMDAQLASNLAFLRRSGDILMLQLDCQHRHLHTSNNLQRLDARLQPLLAAPVRLELQEVNPQSGEVFAAETLTQVLAREAAARQQAAELSIEQDPLVLQLCQRVDGRVDPDSVRPLERQSQTADASAQVVNAAQVENDRHPEPA